ncbi:hypothetical protein BC834DRAFT_976843 [Gloeopeniophorella convolvens]|nr:hypothetical protein BC834DRAFT_976843 [Gloeopeniophorella convolvens]
MNFDLRSPSERKTIDSLHDELLLEIFNAYRLDNPDTWIFKSRWFILADVCRRWREVILASAIHLELELSWGNGTPVADLLDDWPPLPLEFSYDFSFTPMTHEDEQGILLALQRRDHVRSMSLYGLSAMSHASLISAMDQTFSILERLSLRATGDTHLTLPQTSSAPRLRYLCLEAVAHPTGSLLLSSALNLTDLQLENIPISAYFSPEYLAAQMSKMSRLETLSISFQASTAILDAQRDSTEPQATCIMFPKLYSLIFRGNSTWLEGFVGRIGANHLLTLKATFFYQATFTLPFLLRFMDISQRATLNPVIVSFSSDDVSIYASKLEGMQILPVNLDLSVISNRIDRQVQSVIQLVDALLPKFSAVEQLECYLWGAGPGRSDSVELAQWRQLLRSFTSLRDLWISTELGMDFAICLHPDEAPFPELLPELRRIVVVTDMESWDLDSNIHAAFKDFIDARRLAGRRIDFGFQDAKWFRSSDYFSEDSDPQDEAQSQSD